MQKNKNAKPKQDISEVDEFIKHFINSSILINGVPLTDETGKAENINDVERTNE